MFNFSHPHLFQITQHAVIRNPKGAILIVKDDSDWNIPGDRIHVGESWRDALSRALRDKGRLSHFDIKGILEVDSRDVNGETFYDVIFACTIPEFEAHILNKEKVPHAWVETRDLETFKLEPSVKQKLFRWLGNIPSPH